MVELCLFVCCALILESSHSPRICAGDIFTFLHAGHSWGIVTPKLSLGRFLYSGCQGLLSVVNLLVMCLKKVVRSASVLVFHIFAPQRISGHVDWVG